ncbi:MAG: hypothetical protein CL772_06215 [Chloroflexi bacterium]|nr:hypothetical protein [Chloroflexota bacterium]|tara:strand:+ start:15967 stop:16992 length:1026 start_codon:yes stop_codon:yes gene_type:complete
MKKILQLILLMMVVPVAIANSHADEINAQDIPELHMLVYQGDVMMSGSFQKTSDLDGLLLEAKIGDTVVGSARIGDFLTGRFSALEIGPNVALEGSTVTFWVGDQKALETDIFGPLTVQGEYCKGCTWSLPISRSLNLHFNSVPLPTPTPAPALAEPSFITGTLIFGSILAAPEGVNIIEAYIDNELVGSGTVSGSNFSITIDPGNETYLGKKVSFKIAGYDSKTSYTFVENDFITEFKLFFPQYIPATSTPTPAPVSSPVPTATSIPEPTRTPTPVPEPTATYTATATPTPIVLSTSSNEIMTEQSDGGCNSRGGGPASVGLILLSLVPVYLLNRKKRTG